MIPQKGLKYEQDENMMGTDPYCIVCYTSQDRLEQVKAGALYYVRTGERPGAIKVDYKAATVKKIVLLPLKKDEAAYIFDVVGEGADIFQGSKLRKRGFTIKEENLQEPYLTYDIHPDGVRQYIDGLDTNTHIPNNAHISKRPFIIKMSELVKL